MEGVVVHGGDCVRATILRQGLDFALRMSFTGPINQKLLTNGDCLKLCSDVLRDRGLQQTVTVGAYSVRQYLLGVKSSLCKIRRRSRAICIADVSEADRGIGNRENTRIMVGKRREHKHIGGGAV